MVKDHRGDCYNNTFEMCNAWGVDYRLFSERRKRGWSLMRSLITPNYEGTTIFDHEGNIYTNEAAMCQNWGISQPAYVSRRKRGWSVQDALSIPVMKTDDMHKIIEIVEQYEPEDILQNSERESPLLLGWDESSFFFCFLLVYCINKHIMLSYKYEKSISKNKNNGVYDTLPFCLLSL